MHTGVGYFMLFGISAISPTIAGFLTTILLYKTKVTVVFVKQLFCSKFKKKLCIWAAVIPIIEILIMQILLYVNGYKFGMVQNLNLVQILIISYSLIAEETGWRGFLQNHLELNNIKPYLIPVFTGIVWGLWHYHFYLIGSISYPLYWFFIGCISDSYIYYWITRKSNGNIVPASLLHFSYNLMSNLFFVSDPSNFLIYPFFVIGSIVVAVFIIIRNLFKQNKFNI